MSKKRKFTPEPGRFVAIFGWEMDTPAYRLMSVYGRALLVEIRRLYNGSNNGKIGMSVRQAADRLNCNKDTAAKALHELEAKGWIRLATKGSFDWKARTATTWRLTNQPIGLGVDIPATKEYASWRPDEKQNTVPRRRTNGPTSSHRSEKHGPTSSDQTPPDGPTSSDCEETPRSDQTGHSVSTRGEAAEEVTEPTFVDGIAIKAERQRRKLSLRAFGTMAGVSHETVAKVERGELRGPAVAKLSAVLNSSLETAQ